MPIYQVRTPDGRVVRQAAPDAQSALRAARAAAAAAPAPTGLFDQFSRGMIDGAEQVGGMARDMALRQLPNDHLNSAFNTLRPALRAGLTHWLPSPYGDLAADGLDAISGGSVLPTPMRRMQAVGPRTEAQRVARAAGSFLPNAVLGGGGAWTRAGRVVLPALGSEGARLAAQAAGGGATAQKLAQVAGSIVGGGVSEPWAPGSQRAAAPPASEAAQAPSARILSPDDAATAPSAPQGLARFVGDADLTAPAQGRMSQPMTPAQRQVIEAFNDVVANRALKPLGLRRPGTVAPGYATLRHVGDAVDAAKTAAGAIVGKVDVNTDLPPIFTQSVRQLETINPDKQEAFKNWIVANAFTPMDQDALGGANIMDYHNIIERRANELRAQTGDEKRMGQALSGLNDALVQYTDKQFPGFAAAKANHDAARQVLMHMIGAADQTELPGDLFTPTELKRAIGSPYDSDGDFRLNPASEDLYQLANKAEVGMSRMGENGEAAQRNAPQMTVSPELLKFLPSPEAALSDTAPAQTGLLQATPGPAAAPASVMSRLTPAINAVRLNAAVVPGAISARQMATGAPSADGSQNPN